MASIAIDREEAVYLYTDVVRGHHVYKSVWTAVSGEILPLSIEDRNDYDRYAVCVKKGEQIVRHVPREYSRKVWHFLRHGGTSTCEVTGRRKRGNGLEVPYVYRFVAKRRRLIQKLEDLLQPRAVSES